MKQFAKLMLLTLGFGLLAALTGLVGPQPKSTNAGVAAAVNVVNTPGVNANQSGPWNVGINNTPNVNIANTPTVNLAQGTTVGVTGGTFNFSNTSTTPVFVDTELAARNRIHGECGAVFDNFGSASCSLRFLPILQNVVPDGQRLVIETVSVWAFTAPGKTVFSANLQGGIVNFGSVLSLVPKFTGNDGTWNYFADVEQVRFYSDAGSSVICQASSTSVSAGDMGCRVFGYLVTP